MGNKTGTWRSHPALATFGFQGLQVTFSLLSGQSVQHLKLLGLSPTEIAIIVLSGPVCGATFQPYLGSWSDRCLSTWGRRRPFIVVGTTLLITSMLCLAWVDRIVNITVLGSPSSSGAEQSDTRLLQDAVMVITFLCMLVINTATQALQVGLRALVADYGTLAQQAEANTWAGRHINFAAVLAFFAAYFNLPRYLGIQGRSRFTSVSILTAIYLFISVVTTCLCVSEPPYSAQEALNAQQGLDLSILRKVSSSLTRKMKLVFLIQFLAWFGWFPFLFYIVSYIDSLATANFGENNLNLGSLAPLAYSLIALFVAIILPSGANGRGAPIQIPFPRSDKLRWYEWMTNSHILWIASHGVFAVSMLAATFVRSPLWAVGFFSVVGFSWAISSRVPYSILSNELCSLHTIEGYEHFLAGREGLVHGLHNVAICLPQIIIMLVMGVFFKATEKNEDLESKTTDQQFLDIALFLRLGGLFSLAAMYYATKLQPVARIMSTYSDRRNLMSLTSF